MFFGWHNWRKVQTQRFILKSNALSHWQICRTLRNYFLTTSLHQTDQEIKKELCAQANNFAFKYILKHPGFQEAFKTLSMTTPCCLGAKLKWFRTTYKCNTKRKQHNLAQLCRNLLTTWLNVEVLLTLNWIPGVSVKIKTIEIQQQQVLQRRNKNRFIWIIREGHIGKAT